MSIDIKKDLYILTTFIMYAVLKSVGKQFKVSPGDVLKMDKIEGNVGDLISFKDIVAVGNGDKFELGSPAVQGAEVSAKLLHQTKRR